MDNFNENKRTDKQNQRLSKLKKIEEEEIKLQLRKVKEKDKLTSLQGKLEEIRRQENKGAEIRVGKFSDLYTKARAIQKVGIYMGRRKTLNVLIDDEGNTRKRKVKSCKNKKSNN
ncbi:hypothetical protein CHS0354_042591 [Potamilus streckersoni]|uniref:Uncharacterized protein n=1 Tax=Potamilus streckersoni TaxID=2493646 RepID=A0AAE0TET8_9BIVA|nr:hypothetical protein CHS0354_042591 [Potamilus streckersoni]